MAKPNLNKQITEQILLDLREGVPTWVKPWKSGTASPLIPHNATTGHTYRGINSLLLMGHPLGPGWLTYKQAQALGGNVRKGEKGQRIAFWKFFKEVNAAGEETNKKFPMMRAYTVFNVNQCEGLDPAKVKQAPEVYSDATIGQTMELARVIHGGDRAFFSPSHDLISLPSPEQFLKIEDYQGTALHELTHWTGHKNRLDRQGGARFGDKEYAFEELVAELGAAFLCARFGIEGKLQHSEYIASWIRLLEDHETAIISAASQAQKAVDYVLEQLAPAQIEPVAA